MRLHRTFVNSNEPVKSDSPVTVCLSMTSKEILDCEESLAVARPRRASLHQLHEVFTEAVKRTST